eukprot:m.228353 g.228353  ORF g.228353 m.228353 type:complete len:160 (-) comp17456_c0_seq1:290-769(-)
MASILSRAAAQLIGTLWPAYQSFKAIKTRDVDGYVMWMKYWTVFGFFQVVETFADSFIFWLPFYYEAKLLFLIFLIHPSFKGADTIYRKTLHPTLLQYEPQIDQLLASTFERARAKISSVGGALVSQFRGQIVNALQQQPPQQQQGDQPQAQQNNRRAD